SEPVARWPPGKVVAPAHSRLDELPVSPNDLNRHDILRHPSNHVGDFYRPPPVAGAVQAERGNEDRQGPATAGRSIGRPMLAREMNEAAPPLPTVGEIGGRGCASLVDDDGRREGPRPGPTEGS